MSPAKRAKVAEKVAVASIHEEDFSLDDLTIDELEKLRNKCDVALAQKLTKEVPLEDWYYDEPDDRSYGEISFKAKTVHGVFTYEGSIGSDGSIEEAKVGLLREDRGLNEGSDEIQFDGFETRFIGLSDNEAKRVVVKTLLAWAECYDPYTYSP